MKKKNKPKETYQDFKKALKEKFLLDINDVNVDEETFYLWIEEGETIEEILNRLGEKYDLNDVNEYPYNF